MAGVTDQPSDSKNPAPSDDAKSGSDTGAKTDPMKVMSDALQAIVSRSDESAGTTPAPAGGTQKDAAQQGDAPKEGAGQDREKQGGSGGSRPSGDRPKRKRNRKPRSSATGTQGERHPLPARPDGRGGKKRKARGESPMGHANDAVRALSSMLRSVLDSQHVHFLSRPRFMELEMRVPLDARMDGTRCASQLVNAVLKLVADVRDNDDALVPGAVYCFFSESAEAEGCRPDEPRLVFDGYGSTGRPKFTDFVTMAIERKSAGIDKLLGGEEVTLTHVSAGRVLRTAQLAEFGKTSPVFRILGQVDAGLFAVRGQDAKAAFSFQVLLGKDLEGHPVLRLHPVGLCDVMNLVDHSVAQILQRFQGDLDEASLRLRGLQKNGSAPDEEEFILPMLQDLAKRLEDRERHRSRRTEHAERRAAKGDRPTTKAYGEAGSVGDDGILWDDKENTIVVIGGHGRVHIFTPEARHVTSVNMNRANIQQRLKSHRWRETEPGERGGFRMKLRQLVKTKREETESKPKSGGRQKVQSSELQSKIAGLMSGLGGGAATPPAQPEATKPAETPVGTGSSESTPPETDAAETTAVETPPAETTAPETSAPETSATETSATETSATETSATEATPTEATPTGAEASEPPATIPTPEPSSGDAATESDPEK